MLSPFRDSEIPQQIRFSDYPEGMPLDPQLPGNKLSFHSHFFQLLQRAWAEWWADHSNKSSRASGSRPLPGKLDGPTLPTMSWVTWGNPRLLCGLQFSCLTKEGIRLDSFT